MVSYDKIERKKEKTVKGKSIKTYGSRKRSKEKTTYANTNMNTHTHTWHTHMHTQDDDLSKYKPKFVLRAAFKRYG